MGEVTDMIMEGLLCDKCGVIMDDLIPEKGDTLKEPPGYPRTCNDCEEEMEK